MFEIPDTSPNTPDVITQKFNEGEWKPNSENFLYPEPSKSLGIVLILDVSSFLGNNLDDINSDLIPLIMTM